MNEMRKCWQAAVGAGLWRGDFASFELNTPWYWQLWQAAKADGAAELAALQSRIDAAVAIADGMSLCAPERDKLMDVLMGETK